METNKRWGTCATLQLDDLEQVLCLLGDLVSTSVKWTGERSLPRAVGEGDHTVCVKRAPSPILARANAGGREWPPLPVQSSPWDYNMDV